MENIIHSINNKGLKNLHLQLSPWKQRRRDRSFLYFKRKRRGKEKSQDDPKLHARFFFPPTTQGHKDIFQIWQREVISEAGLYINKGVIL